MADKVADKAEGATEDLPLGNGDVGRPEYPICPECKHNGRVTESHVGFNYYCYECCSTFY